MFKSILNMRQDNLKVLRLKKGDKLMARVFEGNAHKPRVRECIFLENINNKFLLVSLGAYKECIKFGDVIW